MAPHDLVLVVGLTVLAIAQLLIYLAGQEQKPRRSPRRGAPSTQAHRT